MYVFIIENIYNFSMWSYLDYFSVYIELMRCSCDFFPADWAQAGHASVPVTFQLDEIPITELGPILQLKTQTSVWLHSIHTAHRQTHTTV